MDRFANLIEKISIIETQGESTNLEMVSPFCSN